MDEQVIPASADMDEDQMQIPWFDKVTTALANERHSLQKGSHTSRGQWAHQVTAAALFNELFILIHRSYADYQLNTPDDEQLHYDEWCKQMAAEHPQFDYWFKVLQLELLFLQFLRSLRHNNFYLTCSHLERSFHGCLPLTTTIMLAG